MDFSSHSSEQLYRKMYTFNVYALYFMVLNICDQFASLNYNHKSSSVKIIILNRSLPDTCKLVISPFTHSAFLCFFMVLKNTTSSFRAP